MQLEGEGQGEEAGSPLLGASHADPTDLTVWKMKGAIIINKSTPTPEHLVEILRSIDVNHEGTIEELSKELVTDLELLLV